jgi:hypothetical protein
MVVNSAKPKEKRPANENRRTRKQWHKLWWAQVWATAPKGFNRRPIKRSIWLRAKAHYWQRPPTPAELNEVQRFMFRFPTKAASAQVIGPEPETSALLKMVHVDET